MFIVICMTTRVGILFSLIISGILSLAVALIHSYTFHEHELRVAEVARSIGFTNVSLSSQIMPMVRLVPRGFTASVSSHELLLK